MTEKYKITVTYDWARDEPNVFSFDRQSTLDFLTRMRVPHDPETLTDGGVHRLDPEPDGLVIRWELDTTVEDETHGRGQ